MHSYVQAGKQASPGSNVNVTHSFVLVHHVAHMHVCLHAGIPLFRKGCVIVTNAALAWRPRQR